MALFWDSDIRPGGMGLKFDYNFNPDYKIFAYGELCVLDDLKSGSDPLMFIIHPDFMEILKM